MDPNLSIGTIGCFEPSNLKWIKYVVHPIKIWLSNQSFILNFLYFDSENQPIWFHILWRNKYF